MTAPAFALYDVPRRCACGNEWMGKSFTKPAEGEGIRPGRCEECLAKDAARLAELTRRAPPVPMPTPSYAPATPPVPHHPDWTER